MVTLSGQANDFVRTPTGCRSFDFLLADQRGNGGIPGRATIELYGPAGHGKSTIAEFIAGRFSALNNFHKIVVADLETATEPEHLTATVAHSGFAGTVHIVDAVDKKRRPRSHEDILQETVDSLLDDRTGAIIVDSLGMVQPKAEVENPLGSANMGRRAMLVAQMNRRILSHLRTTDQAKIALQVNHQYGVMGGRGYVTPGGNSKTYASAVRMSVFRREVFDNGASHVQIRLDKLRYGGVVPNRRGYLFIIPGYGVSIEMTAVFDCLIAKIAERPRGGVLRVPDENGVMQSVGRINTLLEHATTINPDTYAQYFRPFEVALLRNGFTDNNEEVDEDATTVSEE